MQKYSQPISICGPIPKFRCESEEIFLLVRFFPWFPKVFNRKNIFLSKKLIFSQPRSPALHGRLSPFRGGHAVENCKIAPWQIYHAGWRDRKGNSDIKVEIGDTLCLCNNKCGQLCFGKYSPFCGYGQCLSLFSHAGGLVII